MDGMNGPLGPTDPARPANTVAARSAGPGRMGWEWAVAPAQPQPPAHPPIDSPTRTHSCACQLCVCVAAGCAIPGLEEGSGAVRGRDAGVTRSRCGFWAKRGCRGERGAAEERGGEGSIRCTRIPAPSRPPTHRKGTLRRRRPVFIIVSAANRSARAWGLAVSSSQFCAATEVCVCVRARALARVEMRVCTRTLPSLPPERILLTAVEIA